jgi:hypothetical protein
MQGEINRPQQYVGVYAQQDHSADAHEDKTQDGRYQLLKERIEFLVLASPVSLHSKNFLIKETLNMMLKITKFLKHIRFLLKEIYPSELAVIINKTHIVFKTTKGF